MERALLCCLLLDAGCTTDYYNTTVLYCCTTVDMRSILVGFPDPWTHRTCRDRKYFIRRSFYLKKTHPSHKTYCGIDPSPQVLPTRLHGCPHRSPRLCDSSRFAFVRKPHSIDRFNHSHLIRRASICIIGTP